MKVLALVVVMLTSQIAISEPMTWTVKTEQLGMMGNSQGGPRAMVARIRAKMQARRAAKAAKQAAKAPAVAAPQAAAGQ